MMSQRRWLCWGAGWTEGALYPAFEVKVLEDRGKYELVQDTSGRSVLCFKGRRSGFMPEYVDHPVKDFSHVGRACEVEAESQYRGAHGAASGRNPSRHCRRGSGKICCPTLSGRLYVSAQLMGPEDVLYKFYDEPELIHDCMKPGLN